MNGSNLRNIKTLLSFSFLLWGAILQSQENFNCDNSFFQPRDGQIPFNASWADSSNGQEESFGARNSNGWIFSSSYSNDENFYNESSFILWPFPNYFTLAQTEGKGIGYHEGYTTIGLFLAPSFFACNNFQTFIDLDGYIFNNDKWGGSFGLGGRYLLPNQNAALGLNVYYDTRRIHQFDLKQVGVGFEILTSNWDIRVNGYIPVGETEPKNYRLFDYSGDFFALRERKTSSWGGVDGEAGAWIKKQQPCDFFGLYFAAGPYYYFRNHKEHGDDQRRNHAYGGRARLFARVWNIIDLSVIATYDTVWHMRAQGQITLTIPLSGTFSSNRSKCCKSVPSLINQIAIQPVNRNGIIVADHSTCWRWDWSINSSYCHDCSSGSPPESCSTSVKCSTGDCGFEPNLVHFVKPCLNCQQ